MIALLILLGLSFGICVVLTPLVSALAIRYGLVDRPDGRRKLQTQAIPTAGGIAVFFATVVSPLAMLAFYQPVRDAFADQAFPLVGLLLAALIICAVGVADDFGYLRGRHKVLGQLVAVGIVIGFGLEVRNLRFFDWHIELGLLALPFTAFWLLGAINSLNLIDGMDGLLSCVGLIVCLTMAAMAVLCDRWAAAYVAVPLAGALLGFLCYNFPPATIFLGDSGSMLIGLVVGVLAIQSSLKSSATIALAIPVAVLTIPVFDTVAAIIRRKMTGRSIYSTDRAHLHHCLLRQGFSSRGVLLCVSCCCLLTMGGALASLWFHNELFAIVVSASVIASLVATRCFGYAEFQLIQKRLAKAWAMLRHARDNGTAHQSEVHLHGSVDWKGLMDALTMRAFDLNLKTVRFAVNAPAIHEQYHAVWDRFDEELETTGMWRAEIPLTMHGQTVGRLAVSGFWDLQPTSKKIVMIIKLMEDFETKVSRRRAINGEAAPGKPTPLEVR